MNEALTIIKALTEQKKKVREDSNFVVPLEVSRGTVDIQSMKKQTEANDVDSTITKVTKLILKLSRQIEELQMTNYKYFMLRKRNNECVAHISDGKRQRKEESMKKAEKRTKHNNIDIKITQDLFADSDDDFIPVEVVSMVDADRPDLCQASPIHQQLPDALPEALPNALPDAPPAKPEPTYDVLYALSRTHGVSLQRQLRFIDHFRKLKIDVKPETWNPIRIRKLGSSGLFFQWTAKKTGRAFDYVTAGLAQHGIGGEIDETLKILTKQMRLLVVGDARRAQVVARLQVMVGKWSAEGEAEGEAAEVDVDLA